MQVKDFGNTAVYGVDVAGGDRQAALRAMHRVKVRSAAATSSGREPMWQEPTSALFMRG